MFLNLIALALLTDGPTGTLLRGHGDAVYSVVWLPAGSELVTGSFDRTIKRWDVKAGKESETIGAPLSHQGLILCLARSKNGVWLASGGADNSAKLWDMKQKPVAGKPRPAPRSLAHPNLVDSMAFSPSGEQLATGCHDGIVRIWNVVKGDMAKQIQAHPTAGSQAVYSVAWSADGKQVFSASFDRTVKLWDANSGTLVRSFRDDRAVPYLDAASLVGWASQPWPQVTPARLAAHRAPMLNLLKDKTFATAHEDAVFSIGLSPDGKRLATASSDGRIKAWDVATGGLQFVCSHPKLAGASHPGWIYAVAFSSDGKHLLAGGAAPKLKGFWSVWDATSGKWISSGERSEGPIHAIAFSPDGSQVAFACGLKESLATEAVAIVLPWADLVRAVARAAR